MTRRRCHIRFSSDFSEQIFTIRFDIYILCWIQIKDMVISIKQMGGGDKKEVSHLFLWPLLLMLSSMTEWIISSKIHRKGPINIYLCFIKHNGDPEGMYS